MVANRYLPYTCAQPNRPGQATLWLRGAPGRGYSEGKEKAGGEGPGFGPFGG
jgi:hypothetical protein